MKRGSLSILFAGVALAQVGSQEDPIRAAAQAYHKARDHGQFNEAAAKRELARSLLDQIPADSPQLGNSVLSVAQLYSGSGLTAQALAVAQQGLTRVTARERRIQLLQIVADFYQQERNLLEAVVYREKQVAAMDEAAASPAPPDTKPSQMTMAVLSGSFRRVFNGSPPDNRMFAYERLADLYQELGRPESVAAINKRMVAIVKKPDLLAQYYQQQGRLDEAAAIYQKQAEQTDPSIQAGALLSLANIYEQEQRYAEAADAMQLATAALNASGKPELQQQTIWNRMSTARALNLAGQTSSGDQIFEQVLAEAGNAPEGTYLQVLNNYANYLTDTKRDAQGQALLRDYLNSHANLQPQEEANLLFQLANGARRSGDSKLADEYQKATAAMQPGPQMALAPKILIGPDLQAAQAAMNAGKVDEAFELSLHAMATAPQAADREQAAWMVPNLAIQLVNKKQPAKAEQLYQRLFGLVETWSADNPQALITATQNYARFLMTSDRWNEAPAVMKRYHDLIVDAHGATSISQDDAFRLSADFERIHGTPQDVIKVREKLLALHESLAGNTSSPYMQAAEELAHEYQSSGDLARAISIFRQNVAIADLVCRPGDIRRAQARINAAMALAQQRQFDDAEKLATEAVAIAKSMRPAQGDMFVNQLDLIRKMRTTRQPED